jgi:signal transduction histidine kinase
VQVSFDRETDLRDLPGDTALALFRIVQEALRNAATHGSARRVRLSIGGQDGAIELTVADDGKGSIAKTSAAVAPASGSSAWRNEPG